jgi:hypothetical protein
MADEKPLPPPFPAPYLGDEELVESVERLTAPSRRAQRVAAEHLRTHGIERFRLEQHVYLGGHRGESQVLSWNPANATFRCGTCAAIVGTGEITDEIVRRAQLFDPLLRSSLAGLRDQAERDELTRYHLAGTSSREHLRSLRAAGPRRRAASGSRPAVDHRRKQVQEWMLDRARQLGVLERVLDEAEEMQKTDRDRWTRLSDRPLARETLRRYWRDIDPVLRAATLRRS